MPAPLDPNRAIVAKRAPRGAVGNAVLREAVIVLEAADGARGARAEHPVEADVVGGAPEQGLTSSEENCDQVLGPSELLTRTTSTLWLWAFRAMS